MLHSTLPRAFLPPGLSYLGGYYGDDAHLYAGPGGYAPCIEDPYARIPDQRMHSNDWVQQSPRPPSPSPLDLSLKPSHTVDPTETVDVESVELDDDDDDRRYSDTDHRTSIATKRSYSNSDNYVSNMDDRENDLRRSSSVHSYHSYDDVPSRNELPGLRSITHHSPVHHDRTLTSPSSAQRYRGYDDVTTKTEIPGVCEDILEINPTGDSSSPSCPTKSEVYHDLTTPKDILLISPNQSRTHGYHQQLLLTPQHHLQTIHAPMTPPSTPSPPQCPRRRTREDSEVTPTPQSPLTGSNLTPKQHTAIVGASDKPGGFRPKKKHARRLKFDEDTSSPVSGTVILGPDEAVVTGDIDPAFNIVEVTEEARAELAKIENRLGPYQCKLCRQLHDDAFQLAQHRCSRIAHVEYRCPECDKRFSCPANLASHRRWHKPRIPNVENGSVTPGTTNATSTNVIPTAGTTTGSKDTDVACARCDAKFARPASLRKHLASQHPETNNNVNHVNNNPNDYNSGVEDVNRTLPGKTLCVEGTPHLGNARLDNEIA